MVDEIHLNRAFDYKGGNICGMAYNCTTAASSAFVFMIRSLLSIYKDVVHIFYQLKHLLQKICMVILKTLYLD